MTKCYDIKRIDKDKLDKIIEVITENLEYDIEVTGHQDYDVTAYLKNRDEQKVMDELNNILEEE